MYCIEGKVYLCTPNFGWNFNEFHCLRFCCIKQLWWWLLLHQLMQLLMLLYRLQCSFDIFFSKAKANGYTNNWFTSVLRLHDINSKSLLCQKHQRYPESQVHGGQHGAPDGPHFVPMNLAIWIRDMQRNIMCRSTWHQAWENGQPLVDQKSCCKTMQGALYQAESWHLQLSSLDQVQHVSPCIVWGSGHMIIWWCNCLGLDLEVMRRWHNLMSEKINMAFCHDTHSSLQQSQANSKPTNITSGTKCSWRSTSPCVTPWKSIWTTDDIHVKWGNNSNIYANLEAEFFCEDSMVMIFWVGHSPSCYDHCIGG